MCRKICWSQPNQETSWKIIGCSQYSEAKLLAAAKTNREERTCVDNSKIRLLIIHKLHKIIHFQLGDSKLGFEDSQGDASGENI